MNYGAEIFRQYSKSINAGKELKNVDVSPHYIRYLENCFKKPLAEIVGALTQDMPKDTVVVIDADGQGQHVSMDIASRIKGKDIFHVQGLHFMRSSYADVITFEHMNAHEDVRRQGLSSVFVENLLHLGQSTKFNVLHFNSYGEGNVAFSKMGFQLTPHKHAAMVDARKTIEMRLNVAQLEGRISEETFEETLRILDGLPKSVSDREAYDTAINKRIASLSQPVRPSQAPLGAYLLNEVESLPLHWIIQGTGQEKFVLPQDKVTGKREALSTAYTSFEKK